MSTDALEYPLFTAVFAQDSAHVGMPDFGFADYTADVPNVFGQIWYLQAVAACVPDVLRELAALPPDDERALREWAKRRGFEDAWALASARQHARHCHDYPGATGWLGMVVSTPWEPVMPAFGPWNPFVESEDALRERFERYIVICKAAPGMMRTPEKRTGTAHFEWLALHHVGRLTYERLQDTLARKGQHPPDTAELSRAITSTAQWIGLTLRAGRGRKLSRATTIQPQ